MGVASTVTQATITATPYRSDDTVTIDGTAVTGGSDHSVDLSVGLNTFAVVVDSAVTQEQTTYTVYIGRGTTGQGGWKAGDDLDTLRSPGNTSPTGAWSNGATTWIADSSDGKLYAYTLADGSRDSDKDITLDSNNSNPVGIWSDDNDHLGGGADADGEEGLRLHPGRRVPRLGQGHHPSRRQHLVLGRLVGRHDHVGRRLDRRRALRLHPGRRQPRLGKGHRPSRRQHVASGDLV